MDLWICDCEIFVWGKMDKRLQVQHFHVFSCTSSSSWPSPFISTASPIFCLSLLHPLPNNPCPLRCAVPPSVAAHFPSAFSSVQTSAGLSFLTNHSLLDLPSGDSSKPYPNMHRQWLPETAGPAASASCICKCVPFGKISLGLHDTQVLLGSL